MRQQKQRREPKPKKWCPKCKMSWERHSIIEYMGKLTWRCPSGKA